MLLFYILFANILVSSISLVAAKVLSLHIKHFKKLLTEITAFSAGTLLGGAFIHLIPEAAEIIPSISELSYVLLISFLGFLSFESLLHWRHCHDDECEVHTFGYMNLLGDFVHNFIDGLVIAGAFLISIPLGISTTVAVVAHEIPQEIGDFGVLIKAGFSTSKAILFNFLTALSSVIGGIIGFYLLKTDLLRGILLVIAAGGFIYIASTDLIPEIHQEKSHAKQRLAMLSMTIGIIFMIVLKFID